MVAAAQMLEMSLDDIVSSSFNKSGREDRRSERASPEGASGNRRVYVGNLPYSASWQTLKDHMRAAGKVVHCDIISEPGTACGSRGCGVVEFATAEEAKKAIDELHDSHVLGRPIFVREDREDGPVRQPKGKGKDGKGHESRGHAQPAGHSSSGGNPCVFVGNLAYSVTWQDLKDHMRTAGGNVVHCDIIEERGTAMGSKGCGLVQFSTAEEARNAIEDLADTEIKGRPIWLREDRESMASGRPPPRKFPDRKARSPSASRRRTNRSRSRSRSSERGGGSRSRERGGCRLFVGNLPYSATWKDLKDHMRAAGDVIHCDIVGQKGTPMGSKGCGLVEFASSRDAKRAIRDLTDSMLRGRPIWIREDREDGQRAGRRR